MTTTHTVRRNTKYEGDVILDDTGCNVSPSCLACPLPVCHFEQRMSRTQAETLMARARTADVCRLALEVPAPTLGQISVRLGIAEVSTRRLLRLAEARGIPAAVASAARRAVGMRSQGIGGGG